MVDNLIGVQVWLLTINTWEEVIHYRLCASVCVCAFIYKKLSDWFLSSVIMFLSHIVKILLACLLGRGLVQKA